MAREFLESIFSWKQEGDAEESTSTDTPNWRSRKDSSRQRMLWKRIATVLNPQVQASTSSPALLDYNQSDFRQYWMPDSRGKVCYECQGKFTAFRRRHHCRICGQIFCGRCCHLAIPGHLLGYAGDLRVCNLCAKTVVQYLKQSDFPVPLKERLLDTLGEEEEGTSQSQPGEDDTESIIGGSVSSAPKQRKLSDWEDLTPLFASENMLSSPPSRPRRPDGLQRSNSLPDDESLANRSPSPPLLIGGGSIFDENDETEHEEEPDWLRNLEPTAFSAQVMSTSSSTARFPVLPVLSIPAVDEVDAVSHPLSGSIHQETAPPTPTFVASVDGAKKISLAFDDHQEGLMDYLIKREGLPPKWKEVLSPLVKEMAHSLKPNSRDRRDNVDVREYIHVKCFVDELTEPSCRLVFGTAFSKAIADTRMKSEIRQPKILLIAGGIEYERTNRFTSFEPILSQEEKHLSALTAKIDSVNPDLLIVEQTVARTALNAIEAAGITLLSNVKMQVLRRISRVTGAEIVLSVESLFTPPRLGTCGLFKAETLEAFDEVKHVVFLEDCPPDLACSVILTGPNATHLAAAKRVLLDMSCYVYSGRLQCALFSLYSAFCLEETEDKPLGCFGCAALSPSHLAPPIRRIHHSGEPVVTLADVLPKAVLHASPFVSTELPFLEKSVGEISPLRRYFKGVLYPFDPTPFGGKTYAYSVGSDLSAGEPISDEDNLSPAVRRSVDSNIEEPALITTNMTLPVDSEEVQIMLAEYRARSAAVLRAKIEEQEKSKPSRPSRRVQAKIKEEQPLDVLFTKFHQKLSLLFCSFSEKSPNAPGFCTSPFLVQMKFYGTHDVPFGFFLERYCFDPKYNCHHSDTCGLPMLSHTRRMVHGNFCLEISVENIMDQPSGSPRKEIEELSAWNFCQICKTQSPSRILNRSAWQLSFATFLLYMFRGRNLFSGNCSHCLVHEQQWFFSKNNRVACFKLSTIEVHDLRFAPQSCLLGNRAVEMGKTWMEFRTLFDTGESMFSDIEQHIDHYESKGLSKLDDARNFLESERERWRESVAAVQNSDGFGEKELNSLDSNFIEIHELRVKCYRMIANFVQHWNSCVAHFNRRLKEEKLEKKEEKSEKKEKETESTPGSDPGSAERPDSKVKSPPPSPLTSPILSPTIHLSLPLTTPPVIVNEDEISSVIAYALASTEYDEKIRSAREQFLNLGIAINLKDPVTGTDNSLAGSLSTAEASNQLQHIELQFSDASTNFYCKIYFAEYFRQFRKLIFPQGEDTFIRSLTSAKVWKPKGGKSGAAFFKTRDDRLILKQMSRFELQSFQKFAGNYLRYMTVACTENKLTALSKIFGVFRVGLRNQVTGNAVKMDLMVTENLFYDCGPLSQIYDLKGSKRNRLVDERTGHDVVLMDENFVRAKVHDPLYVHPHSKRCLVWAMENDTAFLRANRVMDYSLLVGVTGSGLLVCGLIDCLRTYTLDKRLETWVKSVTGGEALTRTNPTFQGFWYAA